MLGRIGTPAKGANLQGNSLGNQLRRKDILSPFRMFYSLPAGQDGGRDRRAELAQAPRRAKTARPTKAHAPAALPALASLRAALDDLGLAPGLWRPQPWRRLAASWPTTSAPLQAPDDLQERRRRGPPPVGEQEGEPLGPRDAWRAPPRCRVLGPRS